MSKKKTKPPKTPIISKAIKKAPTRASTTGSAKKGVSESDEIARLRAELELAQEENARYAKKLDETKAKFESAEKQSEEHKEAIGFACSFVQRIGTEHDIFSLLHKPKEQLATPGEFQAALLKAKPSPEPPTDCEELEAVLSAIAGCPELKSTIRRTHRSHVLNQKRSAEGIPVPKRRLPVFVFLGNSGTGKTTAARHLGKGLKLGGLLSHSTIVELTRAHLVGSAVGTTGPKVQKELRKHKNKLILIDEAYILAHGGDDDYGPEALAELIIWMEANHSAFVFAGYKDQMLDFIDMNPGFKGRVTEVIEFDDITPNQLAEIFIQHVKAEGVFTLHEDIKEESLTALFASLPEHLRAMHNGRLAKALYDFGIEMLTERFSANECAGWSAATANLIMPADLVAALEMVKAKDAMS